MRESTKDNNDNGLIINNLTDNSDWANYWVNRSIEKNGKMFFEDLKINFPANSTLIEIGGFPGQFAAYFKKKLNCDVTILDYYIDNKIIKAVEKVNGIEPNSIKYIESDFLSAGLTNEYDIVCSFGFIEHFRDTNEIIKKHVKCLKNGGTLFITIPNFRGINGLAQKLFHAENYKKHNINCMNIPYLLRIMREMNMKNIRIEYFGIPSIVFEKEVKMNQYIFSLIDIFGKVIAHIPFKKNRVFAPFICIYGIKQE
jgi:SAM-dependent methyltransferase